MTGKKAMKILFFFILVKFILALQGRNFPNAKVLKKKKTFLEIYSNIDISVNSLVKQHYCSKIHFFSKIKTTLCNYLALDQEKKKSNAKKQKLQMHTYLSCGKFLIKQEITQPNFLKVRINKHLCEKEDCPVWHFTIFTL